MALQIFDFINNDCTKIYIYIFKFICQRYRRDVSSAPILISYRINNLIVETQVKVLERKWYRGILCGEDGTAVDIDSSCDSSEKLRNTSCNLCKIYIDRALIIKKKIIYEFKKSLMLDFNKREIF